MTSYNNVRVRVRGTHEDESMVLYKTKSLDGTKPNTNLKTNPNLNTNPNRNTNPNTNPVQLFYAFCEYRPVIFNLAGLRIMLVSLVPCTLCTSTVLSVTSV